MNFLQRIPNRLRWILFLSLSSLVLSLVLPLEEVALTADKKCPISPYEVIRRMKDVPKILEWSRKKHLTISGPEFFGIHHIYIDNDLKHAVFLLKADLTTHVFIGIPTWAEEWRKYDENVKLLFSKPLSDESLEWKIYQDVVLYRGRMLQPGTIPEEPYCGNVVRVETFNDNINDQWIVSEIRDRLTRLGLTKEGKLMRASLNGDIGQVRAMLRIGVDPNSKTKHGYTALMSAALNGHLDIIKMLLDAGADPDLRFIDGRTALFGAVHQGYLDAVRILLEAGANPNIQEKTAGQAPLHFAVDKNHAEIIKVLINYGGDIEARERQGECTPLMFAVFRGNIQSVKALLDAGANPEVGASGKTPIDLSTSLGFEEITRLLLRKIVENRTEKAKGP